MDEQGVHGCVMFPTTAGLIEEHMKGDLEATHAVFHAYNQWLLEDWTFDYQGRIIPTPAITLPDIDLALAELDWCLEHGARTVLIRPRRCPSPTDRRSRWARRSSTRSGDAARTPASR